MDGDDVNWFLEVEGLSPSPMPVADFLDTCLRTVAKGHIRYNYTAQQLVLPNIITLAGVLDAVPLEAPPSSTTSKQLLDARTALAGFSSLEATQWVYDRYVNLTTTMAKLNPGFDVHGDHKLNPPLTKNPHVKLTDYIVKERLFNFWCAAPEDAEVLSRPVSAYHDHHHHHHHHHHLLSFLHHHHHFHQLSRHRHRHLCYSALLSTICLFRLEQGCIPLTKDHALMAKMVVDNPWPRPIVVYGYDDTVALAGDVFEAETNCVAQHNLGQVASLVNNLAFWSRKPPISTPVRQVPEPPAAPYNKSKTYISIVLGDGDNIGFVKGSRRGWMTDRVSKCAADPANGCFPLTWTLSPRTLHLAPDWLRWYYDKSVMTGADYFTLPPSGDLYAYPGMMPADMQASFVADTERDAALMDLSSSVSWEFLGYWEAAIKHYFPRYGAKGVVRGFFAVNVPYMLPTAPFALSKAKYKLLGEEKNVVLFRPREWRGGRGTKGIGNGKFELTASQMATEIGGYEAGSVAHLYVTSDGGANLDLVYEMVRQLDAHVEVVGPKTLIEMAVQRG